MARIIGTVRRVKDGSVCWATVDSFQRFNLEPVGAYRPAGWNLRFCHPIFLVVSRFRKWHMTYYRCLVNGQYTMQSTNQIRNHTVEI